MIAALALVATLVPQAADTPSPAPQTQGTDQPSASPSASGTPVYNFIYHATPPPAETFPEPGAPTIDEIDVTDQTIAAPGPLHVRILTSDSVVKVVASSYGYQFSIPKTGAGLFTFDGELPSVPGYAKHKRFYVLVTATAENGRVAKLTLPFMLK